MANISEEDLQNAIVTRPLVKPVKRSLTDREKEFLYGDSAQQEEEPAPLVSPFNDDLQEIKVPKIQNESVKTSDGEVIIIKDQKKRVRIKYSHTTPEGKTNTFSVGVPAASVEVQKDGVSILISKDIEIRPPALIPCILEVGTQEQPLKEYSVIFAGATHTIGKYINIPFIIVE